MRRAIECAAAFCAVAGAACMAEPTSPPLPLHLSDIGVTGPVSSSSDLAKVLRGGTASVVLSQLTDVNQNDTATFSVAGLSFARFFGADGAMAVIQPDPAGSNQPSIHLVAVTDADAFASGVFSGDDSLLYRREADMMSAEVSTLRIIVPPGFVEQGDAGYADAHSDWTDFLPPTFQHNGALVALKPPAGALGYEFKAQLGVAYFTYDGERLFGHVDINRGIVAARYPLRQEPSPDVAPDDQALVSTEITFDVFAVDLANLQLPGPPGNLGLLPLSHVAVSDYPYGAREVGAAGGVAAFGSGNAQATQNGPIGYLAAPDGGPTPTLYPISGSAFVDGRAILQPPYLYLPDEGAYLQLAGAPPFAPLQTGAGERQVGGLQIYDVSNPALPQQVGFYRFTSLGTGAHNVVLDGHYAFLFSDAPNQPLSILDVSDPTNPIQVAYVQVATSVGDLVYYPNAGCVQGNTLYVAWEDFGLVGIDVTNPQMPELLWTAPPVGGPISSVAVTADGNFLLTTEDVPGGPMRVWDLSATPPIPVASWLPRPAALMHEVTVSGSRAYVTGYTEGLHVLDVTDPQQPNEIARFIPRWADGFSQTTDYFRGPFEGVIGASVSDGVLTVTDTEMGLYTFTAP
jgi:hypothetical protein